MEYTRGAIFTGARCVFSLRGQRVGFATGVNITEQIQTEPVNVLDDVFIQEAAPVGVNVTFTAQLFRLVGASLKKFGLWPAADHLSVITMGELDATVRDHVTNQTLAHLIRCRCTSRTFETSARGLSAINTEWIAVKMLDETGT
jgi:hypothetical protein